MTYLQPLLDMSRAAVPLLLAIVLLRALLMHKLPKQTFVVLWVVALARLLVPLSIPSPWSLQSMMRYVLFVPETSAPADIPAIQAGLEMPTTAALSPAPQPSYGLFAFWLIGFLLFAVYHLAQYIRCRRRFNASLPVEAGRLTAWKAQHPLRRPFSIRVSDQVAGPLTYGLFRPVILLPKDTLRLSDDALDTILMHEWMHIRRFDAVLKAALLGALCLHWFNPLVWAMLVLANRDIELACDEGVIRARGESRKAAYALTLLHMEETRSHASPLHSHFSKYAIMKMKKQSLGSLLLALVLVASISAIFATSASAASLADQTVLSSDQPLTWYTHEEYAAFIEAEKEAMQTLVEAGEEGWTQETMDAVLRSYEEVLQGIADGTTHVAKPGFDGTIQLHSAAGIATEATLAAQPAATLMQSTAETTDSVSFSITQSGPSGAPLTASHQTMPTIETESILSFQVNPDADMAMGTYSVTSVPASAGATMPASITYLQTAPVYSGYASASYYPAAPATGSFAVTPVANAIFAQTATGEQGMASIHHVVADPITFSINGQQGAPANLMMQQNAAAIMQVEQNPSITITQLEGVPSASIQVTEASAITAPAAVQPEVVISKGTGFTAFIRMGEKVTANIGPYESEAELGAAVTQYCQAQVAAGLLTQAEAHAILESF